MFRQTFYFSLIRKYVTLFGTLFDDIAIERTDSAGNETAFIKVPITYGPKEKMLARILQDPTIQRQSATPTMPFMSFEMTNITYDSTRKLNTVNKYAHTSNTTTSSLIYQYTPVPYNIGFRLYIMVKNTEDATKIIEQILPFFTPDWTTTVRLIPEMNVEHDIPVVLGTVQQEDTYTGDFKERQALTWTLDFTMKSYLYGPVKSGAIILFTNTVFYSPDANNYNTSNSISAAVGFTNPVLYETIQPGLTSNGQPTSNAAQSLAANLISATSDFGYISNTFNLS